MHESIPERGVGTLFGGVDSQFVQLVTDSVGRKWMDRTGPGHESMQDVQPYNHKVRLNGPVNFRRHVEIVMISGCCVQLISRFSHISLFFL
jgi:hypothetical protein